MEEFFLSDIASGDYYPDFFIPKIRFSGKGSRNSDRARPLDKLVVFLKHEADT
jgi:hypothetical protein